MNGELRAYVKGELERYRLAVEDYIIATSEERAGASCNLRQGVGGAGGEQQGGEGEQERRVGARGHHALMLAQARGRRQANCALFRGFARSSAAARIDGAELRWAGECAQR